MLRCKKKGEEVHDTILQKIKSRKKYRKIVVMRTPALSALILPKIYEEKKTVKRYRYS